MRTAVDKISRMDPAAYEQQVWQYQVRSTSNGLITNTLSHQGDLSVVYPFYYYTTAGLVFNFFALIDGFKEQLHRINYAYMLHV